MQLWLGVAPTDHRFDAAVGSCARERPLACPSRPANPSLRVLARLDALAGNRPCDRERRLVKACERSTGSCAAFPSGWELAGASPFSLRGRCPCTHAAAVASSGCQGSDICMAAQYAVAFTPRPLLLLFLHLDNRRSNATRVRNKDATLTGCPISDAAHSRGQTNAIQPRSAVEPFAQSATPRGDRPLCRRFADLDPRQHAPGVVHRHRSIGMFQRDVFAYRDDMLEIRLAWRPDVIHRTFAPIGRSDVWTAATPRSRQVLDTTLQMALEFYGPHTHWIESRERPGADS